MNYRIRHYFYISVLAIVCMMLGAVAITSTHSVSAQTATSTVSLLLEKKFSGTQEGFVESDFSFHITGSSTDETIAHGDAVDLTVGTYTIEELVPSGFEKDDWRIGWYGACESSDEFSTTITVDDGNVDHGTLSCEADNQYRPETDDEDEQETSTSTVDLVLEKKFSGPQEGFTVEQFSFRITGSSTDETIAHGESLALETGTYTIEEIGPQGFDFDDWRIQWSGECEDTDEDNTNATIVIDDGNIDHGTLDCRADNQYRPGDDGGGGNGDGEDDEEARLIIEKVVSGTSTSPSEFSFAVMQGTSTIASTTFESDGSNFMTLATGTYSVIETGTTTDYVVSYDNCADLALTAGATTTCTITNTYDDDDDGNGDGGDNGDGGGNGDDDDDDNGGGGNDDGDGSSSRGGGGRSSSSSSSDDDGASNPGGRVAGEQTTVIPRGAANTGAGGTAPQPGVIFQIWSWFRATF